VSQDEHALAFEKVRFVGDAVLGVVALTEDAAEGVASFLERRDPSWRGF
jgi:1,4-dihydroxy-2-naphthoyl-CoA synthase